MVLTERKIVNVFAEDPEPIDVPGPGHLLGWPSSC